MKTELENEDIYLNETCRKFDQPGAVPFLLKVRNIHITVQFWGFRQQMMATFTIVVPRSNYISQFARFSTNDSARLCDSFTTKKKSVIVTISIVDVGVTVPNYAKQ